MNFLEVKKNCPLIKLKWQNTLNLEIPLEEALEKQTRKKVDAFKSFNHSNKYLNLKKNWEYISKKPDKWFNYWILKETMQLQIKIKLDLQYTVKRIKYYIFSKHSLPFVFLRDIHGGNL